MAKNALVIEGINDFREIPERLSAAAGPLTKAAAERAKAAIVAAYHEITGELRAGVIIVPASTFNKAVEAYYVITTAYHAIPWEFGSQRWNRRPRPTFLPITKRERSAQTKAVVELVRAEGFTVTGDDT
jgi:hypothetical protein